MVSNIAFFTVDAKIVVTYDLLNSTLIGVSAQFIFTTASYVVTGFVREI